MYIIIYKLRIKYILIGGGGGYTVHTYILINYKIIGGEQKRYKRGSVLHSDGTKVYL